MGLVARLNDLAADRPDISLSEKGPARTMSNPSKGCQEKLKRLGRYLTTRPRAIIEFAWQGAPQRLRIYADADWTGCR